MVIEANGICQKGLITYAYNQFAFVKSAVLAQVCCICPHTAHLSKSNVHHTIWYFNLTHTKYNKINIVSWAIYMAHPLLLHLL